MPDFLECQAPERIAFLPLELNAAKAETAALAELAARISEGGIVLMDDYGRQKNVLLFIARLVALKGAKSKTSVRTSMHSRMP